MQSSLTLAITKIGDLLIKNKITEDENGHEINVNNLIIPEYQRPYKWTAKNVNQLCANNRRESKSIQIYL